MKLTTFDITIGPHMERLFLLKDADTILATVSLLYLKQMGDKWLPREAASICRLFVAEPHRRKGIGKYLVRQAMDTAQRAGSTELYLAVEKDNLQVVPFYEKLGFYLYDDIPEELQFGIDLRIVTIAVTVNDVAKDWNFPEGLPVHHVKHQFEPVLYWRSDSGLAEHIAGTLQVEPRDLVLPVTRTSGAVDEDSQTAVELIPPRPWPVINNHLLMLGYPANTPRDQILSEHLHLIREQDAAKERELDAAERAGTLTLSREVKEIMKALGYLPGTPKARIPEHLYPLVRTYHRLRNMEIPTDDFKPAYPHPEAGDWNIPTTITDPPRNWNIEYETPPLRAIYNCQGTAVSEAEAREKFALFSPDSRIRTIKEIPFPA